LRSGGCVLIMRHTNTSADIGDAQVAGIRNAAHERQLDESGRRSARKIGEALGYLRIRITEVFVSPRDRAKDTVRLAGFHQPNISVQLDELIDANEASNWLRGKVTRPPAAGTNILVVTHLPNIVGDFGDWVSCVSPGEILVFRPDGSARVTLFTCIRADRWPALIQVASSSAEFPTG
jgi:phosphohistidine phosphatase SixA